MNAATRTPEQHRPVSGPGRARRRGTRGVTALDVAVAFAIAGSVLAVAVPAFVRDVRGSRLAEPIEGLAVIGEGAVAYAGGRPADSAFPASVPLTPPQPPRGVRLADPPGTWQAPTWVALHFPPPRSVGRAFSDGDPHAFSFEFESQPGHAHSAFVARAHGDLDGNGVLSTFEIRGHADGAEARAVVEPGLFVRDELQ